LALCSAVGTSKCIADSSPLDAYTVKDHLKNIFGKVGVRGRRALLKQLYLDTILP
jgi:DNA-binding CsgD family transcriptional regulator